MGNYNPDASAIIGMEWVPIRQADYETDNITERGYSFQLDHTSPIVSGAFYVTEAPTGGRDTAHLISVYPENTEDLTGPIKEVIIPVESFAVTGAGAACDPTGVTECMTNFSDSKSLLFLGGNSPEVGVSFDVSAYSQRLFGKRILNVELLYLADGTTDGLNQSNVDLIKLATPSGGISYGSFRKLTPGATISTTDRFYMSDLNPFWQPGVTNLYSPIQKRIYPWRYQELANLDGSATGTDRMVVRISSPLSSFASDFLAVYYMALKVTYCEERRVMYGGYYVNANQTTDDQWFPDSGGAFVQLRDTNFAIPSSTAAGRYVVTQTARSLTTEVPSVTPTLRQVRELYPLTPQRGKVVNYNDLTLNEEFTSETTDLLPQITLHTASAIVTSVHPYGTSVGVPVYGSVTAIQEIEDDPAGSSKQYPQVRFYARRFGDTTVALRLIDVATGTFTASITVEEFDALPEIVDGWKEVNLRFASPPSFATAAGDVDWRWDAVGETAGNQWQILAADGPSFTGSHAIGPATYGTPANGSAVALTWQSPAISGTAEDSTSDAVLIFSTDPASVTGFAVEVESQAVTGIGLNCDGLPPNCIPSAVYYHQLSWTSPVVSGWVEIQRSDEVDDWQQIALIPTVGFVTGFADYEARVGVQSDYRVRMLNALDFAGSWATASSTLTSPGVLVGGDGNSTLIFTSNSAPERSLAYTMAWQGRPIEQFIFAEADQVTFQRMFGRNFPVAFHPLEREGTSFSRTIVINAAAITLPSLADFRDIRDLAWDDIPNVCVRDEIGNRWFANVRVPNGDVSDNRTTYIAQIQVTEVSETPYAVTEAQ